MSDVKVPDGTASKHTFLFLNDEGKEVPVAESAKYRVVDRNNDVVLDWTNISPPVPGPIKVSGEANRVRFDKDTIRKITIVAHHNGGETITGEIKYALMDFGGIQAAGDLSN